ncbi:uncharacterized protein [Triticum aestivum]|uniref:uncharacterized protein n=1 Tax=Triticum aestivum TaxID=4565 RepID=UPI001D004EAF|nr:uncharacterized protein LOC123101242 [Triticum aestivum]
MAFDDCHVGLLSPCSRRHTQIQSAEEPPSAREKSHRRRHRAGLARQHAPTAAGEEGGGGEPRPARVGAPRCRSGAAHERDPFFPSSVGLVNCSSFCFSLISLLFLRRCGGRARRDDRRSAFDGRPRNNEQGDQGFAEGGVIRSRLFLISR